MKLLIVIIALIAGIAAVQGKSFAAEQRIASLSYSLSEERSIPLSDQVKLAKYVSLLPPLMKDWSQTHELGRRGFDENNPLLGRQPSSIKINSYFLAYSLSILAAYYLPEPFSSSILDTIRYQEEIVTFENERLFNREAAVTAAPIAVMFTIRY